MIHESISDCKSASEASDSAAMPSASTRIKQRQAIEGKPYVEDPIADYTTPLDRPTDTLTPAQKERQRLNQIEVPLWCIF